MGINSYINEYRKEAIKLAKEVGTKQASAELVVPKGTLYGWLEKERSILEPIAARRQMPCH